MFAQSPIDTLPWHAATALGGRTVNADAIAAYTDPATGRSAFVVADGVGDSEAAAHAARLAADVAAVAAVTEGARGSILAAARALPDEGDCVLVVAVPDALSCDVAWVGDCRAYHSNGRVLEQITVDHTVAEYYRSRGGRVLPRMEHLVTTSVRTVVPERIGTSRTGLTRGRLLLCSDGVHKPLPATRLRATIDRPESPERVAALLVAAAMAAGGRDNATALVVDHPVGDTTAWSAV